MYLITYVMIKSTRRKDHLPEKCILKYLKYAPKGAFGQGKPGLTEINVTVLARKHLSVSAQIFLQDVGSIWNHFYHGSYKATHSGTSMGLEALEAKWNANKLFLNLLCLYYGF